MSYYAHIQGSWLIGFCKREQWTRYLPRPWFIAFLTSVFFKVPLFKPFCGWTHNWHNPDQSSRTAQPGYRRLAKRRHPREPHTQPADNFTRVIGMPRPSIYTLRWTMKHLPFDRGGWTFLSFTKKFLRVCHCLKQRPGPQQYNACPRND